jgi:hypothetical protein
MSSKKIVELADTPTFDAKNVRTNSSEFKVWRPFQSRVMAALRAANTNKAHQCAN